MLRWQVKRHITEYFWSLKVVHRITAVRSTGEAAADRITLTEHAAAHTLVTSYNQNPIGPNSPTKYTPLPELYADITWLVKSLKQHKDAVLVPDFKIDRDDVACATPRRNVQVDQLLSQTQALREWATRVDRQLALVAEIGGMHDAASTALGDMDSVSALVPVWPLLRGATSSNETSAVLATAGGNAGV